MNQEITITFSNLSWKDKRWEIRELFTVDGKKNKKYNKKKSKRWQNQLNGER